MQPSFFSHLAVLWASGKNATIVCVNVISDAVCSRVNRPIKHLLHCSCLAIIRDFALLALCVQGVKARVEPIIFITLGSIKYLNVGNDSLGYIQYICCVFKMSAFVCL